MGKPWSPQEDQIVKRMVSATAEEIREVLARCGFNRTRRQIYRRRGTMGLTKPHMSASDIKRLIQEMASAGLSSMEIGRRTGMSDTSVRRWRKRLGLPGVSKEALRQAGIAGYLKRAANEDYIPVVEARNAKWAVAAVVAGWPRDVTPPQAKILEYLEGGVRNIDDICEHVGRTKKRVCAQLRKLAKKGYVVKGGEYHSPDYWLAPACFRKEHALNNRAPQPRRGNGKHEAAPAAEQGAEDGPQRGVGTTHQRSGGLLDCRVGREGSVCDELLRDIQAIEAWLNGSGADA